MTALSPKSIAFFIAFVPRFTTWNAVIGPQFAVLITTFVMLAALNALAVALLADQLRGTIKKPSVIAWLTQGG